MASVFVHGLRAFRPLRRDNSTSTLLELYTRTGLKSKREMAVRVLGEDLVIRTSAPDLRVALSSLGGEYQPLARAFPRDHAGLIVDAGGYIGTAAIALARMYPAATVVTIEPSPANFALLARNVAAHRNIHPLNAALAPAGRGGRVTLKDAGSGEWGFTIVDDTRRGSKGVVAEIDTISLDAILARFGFDRISILKMDIEGGERDLLAAPAWLERAMVYMVELHERNVPGCNAAFDAANAGRFVFKAGGEKFVSVSRTYFDAK